MKKRRKVCQIGDLVGQSLALITLLKAIRESPPQAEQQLPKIIKKLSWEVNRRLKIREERKRKDVVEMAAIKSCC